MHIKDDEKYEAQCPKGQIQESIVLSIFSTNDSDPNAHAWRFIEV